MNKEKLWWAVHNIVGHPIMEISGWFGLYKFANWIHDVTLPSSSSRQEQPFNSVEAAASFAEFDILNSCDPEIFAAKDWQEAVQLGWYNEDDGTSFWGTSTHYNYDHCGFGIQPTNATHVHWFSK